MQDNSLLSMKNTGYSVCNSGTISTSGSVDIDITGTVLNNTGTISGTGIIYAGEMADVTDYENGIEYSPEVQPNRPTPSNYSHYQFVADPGETVEAIYFIGEVSTQAGGSCTLTVKNEPLP